MKKFVLLILVLCLAGVVLIACFGQGEETAAHVPEVVEAEPEETPAEPEPATVGVEYEAIYALHDPAEIVMTVDGQDVTWEEYFYFYFSQAQDLEQQFEAYQSMGYAIGWNSVADAEGHSYAQIMGVATEHNIRRILTVETAAAELGAQLTEEEEAALQQAHEENILYYCGKGGTEEAFFEAMKPRYLNETIYWRIMRFGALYEACCRELTDENGEALDETQAEDWMKERMNAQQVTYAEGFEAPEILAFYHRPVYTE